MTKILEFYEAPPVILAGRDGWRPRAGSPLRDAWNPRLYTRDGVPPPPPILLTSPKKRPKMRYNVLHTCNSIIGGER